MGRAFEYRKARKLKRWGNMARTFTRIGREIEIAVKAGGPDPNANLRLRLLMQTAKSESMPKENVERAIKRATSKDTSDYKEVVYDGKGPHGVAVVVETATDNPTRTVANIRAAFVRGKGELGTMGMNDFLFERKCTFTVAWQEGIDMDELELELIDCDIDEVFRDEDEIVVSADFKNYGPIFFGTINKFKEVMQTVPDDAKVVIIRMRLVSFMDQSGLYAMEEAIKELQDRGAQVLMTIIQPQPLYMLRKMNVIPDLVPEDHTFETFEA